MKDNEQVGSVSEQKERIRNRYKGIDPSELDIIPAIAQEDFYKDTREKRVAVYARVSTDDPRQTSSYELQKNHYENLVNRHEGWNLIDIYADEGISGTSLQHREAFKKMIADCRAGKIDLIVTKSVSRFARNIMDSIGTVRILKALNPPIGVFFETENIYTLNADSEMSLSFISTMAQEESHTKSEIMNSSIEMRFRMGIFLTPPLLGYDVDNEGNLTINEEEAKIVRFIFFSYLYGYTCQQIAESLTNLNIPTKTGKEKWSAGTVNGVLKNERHCGDVLARKTFTPDYLNHKTKKNNQDRNQYRKKDHHDAIVTRSDFIAVQHLMRNAKFKSRGILPELQVITEGGLKGFVIINMRWAAFTTEDYINASNSAFEDDYVEPDVVQLEAQDGDIDYRDWFVVRSQFLNNSRLVSVSFDCQSIGFTGTAVKKLPKTEYVELLLHPTQKLLLVKPSNKEARNAVHWASINGSRVTAKRMFSVAFIPTLFKLMGWDEGLKYKICGTRKTKGDASYLIFDLKETEVYIPMKPSTIEDLDDDSKPKGRAKKVMKGYPVEWADEFGDGVYQQVINATQNDDEAFVEPQVFKTDDSLDVTPPDKLASNIGQLLGELKQDYKVIENVTPGKGNEVNNYENE